jgi:hypothetical protein
MRIYILLLFLLTGFGGSTFAQIKIGEPADVNSSDIPDSEELLIAQLTTEQVNAIQNPAIGLLIYNTDLNLLQVNIGTETAPQWHNITITYVDNRAVLVPVGTDADRPVSPEEGTVRYNTSRNEFEIYSSGEWTSLE